MKTTRQTPLITNIVNTIKNKPVLILGQIGPDRFKAEIHPKERVVLCSGEFLNEPLKTSDAERRASLIGKRLLTHHWLFLNFKDWLCFKNWLFVEVQTCFGKPQFAKVTGLRIRNGGRSARYEDLSPEEDQLIQPLINPFLGNLRSRSF